MLPSPKVNKLSRYFRPTPQSSPAADIWKSADRFESRLVCPCARCDALQNARHQTSASTEAGTSPNRIALSNRQVCPCSRCLALEDIVSPNDPRQPGSPEQPSEPAGEGLGQKLKNLKIGKGLKHLASSWKHQESPNASTSVLPLNTGWREQDITDADRTSVHGGSEVQTDPKSAQGRSSNRAHGSSKTNISKKGISSAKSSLGVRGQETNMTEPSPSPSSEGSDIDYSTIAPTTGHSNLDQRTGEYL